MPDAAYDSADPRFEEADRKEQGRRDATDRETVRVWMGHPNGRALLYRFIYETCSLGEIYAAYDTEGRSDTHRTYLAMGMRNAGAWLDGRMREHAELYMKMLDEQRIEADVRASRLEKLAKERDETHA